MTVWTNKSNYPLETTTTPPPSGGGGGDMYIATYDPAGISQQVVGTTATQTLTHKTINDYINSYIDADALHTKVFNNSGGALSVGTPVYNNQWNAVNSAPEVIKARANSLTTCPCHGLVEESSIADGSVGSIRTAGILNNVDTSAWSDGQDLYLSASTAGVLTPTPPSSAGQYVQFVGTVVRQHATLGVILVQIGPAILVDTDAAPATTVTTQTYGDAGTVGTATTYAREDHKHGFPASVKDTTAVTGILKGNGTAISAAVAGDFPTLNQNTTGSAATLTTSRNIGGRSFNGSADIIAPTCKTGITTRDITTASGTVNVAHGLGRVPSIVRVRASLVQTGNTHECYGVYDGTNHAGMCTIQQEGTSTAVTDTIYTSTSFELGFSAATVVNPYTGANRQTATITCDATNIIFTWTKTGTVASATANILWEVM